MRIVVAAAIGVVVLCGPGGCAQRDQAVSTAPSHAELPTLKHVERIVPAKVGVEHRRGAVVQLIPEFVEPELTPEEREALGQRELLFSFLEYDLTTRRFDQTAGPYDAGVSTGVGGYGGARAGTGPFGSLWAIHGAGGVSTGTDTFGSTVSGRYLARESASAVGPREEVRVQTGTTKQISARRLTND